MNTASPTRLAPTLSIRNDGVPGIPLKIDFTVVKDKTVQASDSVTLNTGDSSPERNGAVHYFRVPMEGKFQGFK